MRCDLPRYRRPGRLDSIGAPAWLLGPVVVVALALAAAGWLAVRDVPATVTWLDIGSPGDDAHITGAFPPEQNLTESYRWTTSSAIVTVPAPSSGRYRLDIAIASTGEQARTLQITCPGDELIAPLDAGWVPPILSLDCRSDGEILVSISVPETRVPGDGRPLGIAIRDIRVTAIDRETIAIWRLRAGLMVGAAIVGSWLAVAAVVGKRVATAAVLTSIVGAVAIIIRHPDWILAAVAGPPGLIALAAGHATWLLATGRRTGPFALGLVSVASWFLFRPPNPSQLLPALWTPHDATGYALLPWLAAPTIIAAALIGGRRSVSLAAAATLIAAGSMFVLLAARPVLERWSLVINGPDWADAASPVGGLLLAAIAIVTLQAFHALPRSPLPPRLVLVTVVVLALAVLVPWRNAIMDLNGDEPHYYVTAHSIAADADLELLDDYLEPDYLSETISPTGNIAVERATHPDRYVAFAPAPENARYLISDAPSDLTAADTLGPPSETENPLTVVDSDGDLEMLPQLALGSSLVIPLSGPCNIESLQLASPGDVPTTATIRLLDTTRTQLHQDSVQFNGTINTKPPLDASICTDDFAGAILIEADRDILAQAIDTAFGLRILAARPAGTDWLLGPLPRDRYATQDATARLALHNPGSTPLDATVRLLTASETLLRATSVSILPGATIAVDLDLHDGAAVSISATAPIVVGGTGWLPGGSFALPVMPSVTVWQLDIPAATDRDAGLWLALANPTPDPRTVTVDRAGTAQSLTICGFCAEMLHVPSDDSPRNVTLSTIDGPIAVAAVIYEERTGSLHFDLGLPLLAALPVRLVGPDAAPLVSALATILLAVGLFDLLRRIGVTDAPAAWGAGAVVLLAPLSPYAVRLYTEPLAACLIVWSLVYWDRARSHPGYALATLLLAGALPLVHGRYAPLALALAALAIIAGIRRSRVSRRQLLVIAVVAIVLVVVVAVSPLAVALRDRASGSYFSPEWAPHNLLGILLDRGSGLLPFAPWCLLALAAPRRLHPLQRAAILLFVIQITVIALRAGGWQTFGAPARYILPVVPLVALLAVPGALRLWGSHKPLPNRHPLGGGWGGVCSHALGRSAVTLAIAWSTVATLLLHWLPLSGYIYEGRYFLDDARRKLPLLAPFDIFPAIAPSASSNLLGLGLLLLVWAIAWVVVRLGRPRSRMS